jgi:hypothetical protein
MEGLEGSWTQITSTYTSLSYNDLTFQLYGYCGTGTSSYSRGIFFTKMEIDPSHLTALKTVSGTVTEGGSAVARTVRAYDRDNGELLGEATSDAGDGTYAFGSLIIPGTDVYVIALDDDAGTDYNALIDDRVTPGDV